MELTAEEKSLFGKTQSTGDRPSNFSHGKYLLMVDVWKLFRGRTALVDIHNFVVLKSERNPVKQDDKVLDEAPNATGTRVGATFKWSNDDAGTMARQNSVKFICSMFGVTDADLTEASKLEALMRGANEDPKKYVGETDDATGQPIPSVNPLRGAIIAADTTPVFTKTTKKWITVVNFIHIASPGTGENSYVEIAKRWQEYEARLKAAA